MSTDLSVLEVSRLHAEALVQLTRAGFAELGAAVTVYFDQVPVDGSVAWPYVVFWSSPSVPWAPAARIAGWGGEAETVIQATVACLHKHDVLGIIDRLVYVLHGRTPVIPGRVAGDIEVEVSTPRPERDPAPTVDGRDVWTGIVFARLVSTPRKGS